MGGEQAAGVLVQIKEEQLNKANKVLNPEEKKAMENEIIEKYEYEGSAYYSTSRLWDDGIIDPVDTRKIIGMGIAASLNKKYPNSKYGVFRM